MTFRNPILFSSTSLAAARFAGRLLLSVTCLAGLATAPAWADDLDDILGEPEPTVEPAEEEVPAPTERERRLPDYDQAPPRRVIQTLQEKNFLKIGRWELTPQAGFVANDPFINRYLGGVSGAYHLTEVFAVEGSFLYSPDFGTADWKPITTQLVEENKVSPDISKIEIVGNLGLQFSPIYGKLAFTGQTVINFDIFGTFGTGFVRTNDDLQAIQGEGVPSAVATEVQIHPTTNIGGGFRVIFSESFATRLEARSLMHIETIDSTTLQMKNNVLILASASFFIPRMD